MAKELKGFFSDDELREVGIDVGGPNCAECKRNLTVKSPKMNYTGQGLKKALIIAEAPGEEEDNEGKQLIGPAGQVLRKHLKPLGFDLDRDFYKINACNCRIEGEPTMAELGYCAPMWHRAIEQLKPKFIILVGNKACDAYFTTTGRWTKESMSTWRGHRIPDWTVDAWVLPIFHPSYLLYQKEDELPVSVFKRDLKKVCEFITNGLRPSEAFDAQPNPYNHVHIMTDFGEVCYELRRLLDEPPAYLIHDYETTAVKPFKKGHKIASISYCADGVTAYAFPFQYHRKGAIHPHWTPEQFNVIRDLWASIQNHPEIRKVAHSMKFESIWTEWIVEVIPQNLFTCTMIDTHILDNRPDVTSLKFQAFIRWGLEDWSKEVDPYLKNTDKDGFNRVMEIPLQKLLLYNGVDSITNFWLFQEQQEQFAENPGLQDASEFFNVGNLALAEMQMAGINTDKKYYAQEFLDGMEKIRTHEKELRLQPGINEFFNKYGKDVNFKSNPDMKKMFYEVLKEKPVKVKGVDSFSVDEKVIATFKSPLAKKLIELRKQRKITETYIAQFLREIDDDGRLRPFFNLHLVRTFRGSSEDPNFQNIPVRDEYAKKATRIGIKPSLNHLILDADYGAQEVRIIACYSQDPALVAYILDGRDPHADTAKDLFYLSGYTIEPAFFKKFRFHAKNGFVFPEFYTSWYKSCARNIWAECMSLPVAQGYTIREHLQDVGIIRNKSNPYDDWEKHVKHVEGIFWDRFPYVKKWQDKTINDYIKKGYVEMFTGFRCSGYLSRANIVNYPVQGTAFHCLLYTIIRLREAFQEHKWLSRMIAQIHDNLLIDTIPQEKYAIKDTVEHIATKLIMEEWRWLIVPLILEWEEVPVGGSWYSKKDYEDEI